MEIYIRKCTVDVHIKDNAILQIELGDIHMDYLKARVDTVLRSVADRILRTLPQTQCDQAIESNRR